jgi:hypothetical protein
MPAPRPPGVRCAPVKEEHFVLAYNILPAHRPLYPVGLGVRRAAPRASPTLPSARLASGNVAGKDR